VSTLLLLLAGPLQSWGDSSRYTRRETRQWPTKSGILGLLAAAQGRRRTDSIEDLLSLRFGVRVDQPGRVIADFQTARPRGAANSGLSNRYYLSDAVFVAGVEGDEALLEGLDAAVKQPAFPLYLGRRSCPPSRAISLGTHAAGIEEALRSHEWTASGWYRRTAPQSVSLELFLDADPSQPDDRLAQETVRDVPISFDSTRRQYGWRDVIRPEPVTVDNPSGSGTDWFVSVRGA
jgi:CRISPR system Cascade subunit CasD